MTVMFLQQQGSSYDDNIAATTMIPNYKVPMISTKFLIICKVENDVGGMSVT